MRPHNYEAHARWNSDNGDRTHRLNYDLNENSLVWDIGGYEGNWAQDIFDRYKCNIWIFEPVPNYYNALVERFKGNDKIKVHPFGLGDRYETVFMNADGDGSTYKDKGEPCKIHSITDFIKMSAVENIDLVKINIEGAEYSLLESMVQWNQIVDNFQIQFHVWIDNCEDRHNKIVDKLLKTHDKSFSYEYIWEGFKRKNK